MIQSGRVGLRARYDSDVQILHSELYDDVPTWSRSDAKAWRPIAPGSPRSPYAIGEPSDSAEPFSVVELGTHELVGDGVLWGIDRHNRTAHLGLSLRPDFRGRGLGTDVVQALCKYGFTVLNMQRLQIETLADNLAMINAATKAGFTVEGTLRHAAWVYGAFIDEVILGLLVDEWKPLEPRPAANGGGDRVG